MTKEEMEALIKSVTDSLDVKLKGSEAAVAKAVNDAVEAKMAELKKANDKKDIHGDGSSGIKVEYKRPDFLSNKGKFFMAVHKAATDSRTRTDLATALEADWKEKGRDPKWVDKAPAGMNTVVSADGGFLPTAEIMTEIKETTYETGMLLKECDVMPLGGSNDTLIWKEAINEDRSTVGKFGGIQAYRNSEGSTVTYSGAKFRERELRVKDMMALVPVTNQLLQDATSLGALISKYTPAAFNDLIDNEIIRGNGAGECLGIVNAAGALTVAAEGGQAVDTILYENIIKMNMALDPTKHSGAKWYVNPFAQGQLWKMSLAVGTGGAPIYLPAGSIANAPFATLMGIPVVPNQTMSKLGDVGDIMLANMNDYLIVDKGGIEGAESMHVLFTTNENMFRFTWRINGVPKPATTITPKYGAATDKLASFVLLAAR